MYLKSITLLNYLGTGLDLKLPLTNNESAWAKPGDTRAITGPNGYGKSLILDAINTLLYPGEHLPKAIPHFADKIILKGDSGKVTWTYKGSIMDYEVEREGTMPTAVFVGEETTYTPIIDGPITDDEHEYLKSIFGKEIYPKNASEYSLGFKRFVKIMRAAKEAQEGGRVLLIDMPESYLHMYLLLTFCKTLSKLQQQQVNSNYFLDGKAIMDLFAKPVKINRRNYITDVMRKMDSLLQDVWWYTEMSYGDIIITRGHPYQLSPFDQNNPFVRIVRQWSDKGEYAREMYQALEEIKKLLKDEDHKAGEYWASTPYQQLGYIAFPEETKQPT